MSTQQKAYNVDPYFDDFDEDKNFYQILYKPGVSVQSRELTQQQTILRDQIKKFGDHVFQQGSIVIPGNSLVDDSGTSLKLEDDFSGTPIDVSMFMDQTIVGDVSGVEAVVRFATAKVAGDPNALIIHYTKAGVDGQSNFNASEEIYCKDNISIRALLTSDPFGTSSLAYINDGVYYVNGTFVKVKKQTALLGKFTNTPSIHVLLKIEESIVDYVDDQSLLDPAQGSPNYAAPGADRLKINLSLVTLPLGSEITDNYIEIMRLEEGVLVYHSVNPKYSELEKSLARRTYDESGDYVVRGFNPSVLEHLKQQRTKGLYPAPVGDRNKFVVQLTPGKAYIRGFEKERIATTNLVIDKARTSDHIKYKQSSTVASYGQIIYISNLVKLPNIDVHETVTFYNTSSPSDSAATVVGTARTYAIEYKEGQGIYSLFIYDAVLTPGKTYEDIGGIRFGTGGSAYVLQKLGVPNATGIFQPSEIVNCLDRTATVAYHDITSSVLYVYKHSKTGKTPRLGDTIVSPSTASAIVNNKSVLVVNGTLSSPLVPIPLTPISTVRKDNGDPDIIYQVYKYLTITTDATGNGSVNIDNGRLDAITPSSCIATWAGGPIAISLFSMTANGTTLSITGGPLNAVISIQVTVTKIGLTEKTKVLLTTTDSSISLSGGTTGYLQLTKADVYQLVTIVSSVDGDVTEKFTLDDGQRNYYYDLGRANLNGSVSAGATYTVTYKYFNHSSSGDYFTVDSYKNSGIADSNDLDFLSYIPSFYSKTDSQTYSLSACYDFRKIIGNTGDAIINGTSITATYGFYVPRIDVYGLGVSEEIVYYRGIPEEIPELPKAPDSTFILGVIKVPAWTPDIKAVNVVEQRIRRFTMSDINGIDSRLNNLENVVSLTLLENKTINMDIIDPITGLNRYKMGILTDDFSSARNVGDFYNKNFAAEYGLNSLYPPKEWVQTELRFDASTSSNYQVSGDIITLPYVETMFIRQPFSTKITNVNPFLVIAWVGAMTLTPNVDSWVETEDLPNIVNTTTQTVTIMGPRPPDPPPVVLPPPPVALSPVPAPLPAPAPVPPVTVVQPTPAPVPVPAPVPAPAPAPELTWLFWDNNLGVGPGYYDLSGSGLTTDGGNVWGTQTGNVTYYGVAQPGANTPGQIISPPAPMDNSDRFA